MWILSLIIGLFFIDPNVDFAAAAAEHNIPKKLLEGICKYESDSGRVKHYKNRNGSWDVGLCQNHRKKSAKRPKVPNDIDSVAEAAEELAYWRKAHNKFCVKHYKKTGQCGYVRYGKFRGVKNCTRNHFWWEHYNHGFRVLKNEYGRKAKCFMEKGNKKCKEKEWKKVIKPAAHERRTI